ncbi:MAG: nucleotidyltransferase family protein [Bacteroidales bacterium]|nr:nucleotidyltransferase family protein [Bacteroidales bacterium]MCF8402392.1 nucleotidyltransferase family protein [Bacteroidales bacterium]
MFTQEAIILAGGKGTRLKEVVSDVPKVMAPINGRPFLEYVLDYLENYVVEHVVLSVGYMHKVIMDHFGNQYKSITIDYAIEEEALGTGGGIKKAFEYIHDNRAFVFNGDTMFRINLIRLFDFQISRETDFSMVLRQVDNVSRYGAVEYDDEKRITGFFEKGEQQGPGMINGGVYLIHKRFFNQHQFPDKFSIEKDCFEKMVNAYPFFGIVCKQYFLDIGIPEDYERAQHEFKEFNY